MSTLHTCILQQLSASTERNKENNKHIIFFDPPFGKTNGQMLLAHLYLVGRGAGIRVVLDSHEHGFAYHAPPWELIGNHRVPAARGGPVPVVAHARWNTKGGAASRWQHAMGQTLVN